MFPFISSDTCLSPPFNQPGFAEGPSGYDDSFSRFSMTAGILTEMSCCPLDI